MKKIILVDDDRELNLELEEMLSACGYAVDLASSGPEGESMILKGDYELAVIDYKMPGFDGIELLRKVMEKKPALRVVILSGSLDIHAKIEDQRLRSNVCLVMQKPFDAEKLVAEIERLCS